MKKQGILNIVLLIALIAFAGVSVYKVEQNNKDIAQAQIQINELKATIDKQSKELSDKDTTIKDLKSDVQTAQEKIKKLNETSSFSQTGTQVGDTQSNTSTYNPF
ncbi:hypothetical protein BW731_05205 [Vagococcus martis]|uniref:Uncharacterized protein n=1 Tax=Vagococcus martis TaxID=1768210 RepID=A0A1V4DGJ2_9ENTE|nr:hypothetical protein [Vagococcus martis]OPF87647.1 hypothetical protein BW731_05205 [Vagococcus martis]